MSSSSVFSKKSSLSNRRPSDVIDTDVEFDIREDEEQGVKLQQMIDLLLAAGYFRARIKGLSAFDKVVGGMTWCITTCNFDLDVDLLFQENSTIGQKIALTEKIVAVLPRMKCPHRIEPHQIQGLDFIHIFPVVQWLVKRAIETREETGDLVRQHSVHLFNKSHRMPEDDKYLELKTTALDSLHDLKGHYKPVRKYRRQDAHGLDDEESRVHSTLLEYGRKFGIARIGKEEKKADSSDAASTKQREEDALWQEEEETTDAHKRISALMSGMAATNEGKLTASAVGSIVSLQSEAIQQMASEYAGKHAELEKIDGQDQHHKHATASLQKRIQQQNERLVKIQENQKELEESYTETRNQLKLIENRRNELNSALLDVEAEEAEADQQVLQQLRSLVAMNENLKLKEHDFKAKCKEEKLKLEKEILNLKEGLAGDGSLSEEQERRALIEKQLEADKEKMHKIRLLLARKNREISTLQRRIDEIPSRAELGQYQRRFVELYNQIAAKHKETKQFYTLYNKLDDTKLYLNKEVNLLNSIHDNFAQAMSTASNKEDFLKQMETIVEGVKQNKTKIEKKRQEEKMRRDHLNDEYLVLVDKQRHYFKTIKDFKEECRKNEMLMYKLQNV